MDRALYIAMTGASETMRAQAVNAHNLANVSTTGFRSVLAAAEAAPIPGGGVPSRVNSVLADAGFDPTQGSLQQTGRPLDVAITIPDGWLAVQANDGSTAYTRRGDLQITSLGQLVTGAGQPVLSGGSPLTIPPSSSMTIAADGTVSVVPQGSGPASQAQVGRLQVVRCEPSQLQRGDDGLMRLRPGAVEEPVPGTALAVGALESSNVNASDALVRMIELARQFELQVKAMRTAEENERSAASLLRMS